MEKACIVCTTPYQLMTGAALAHSIEKDADLYVVDQFRRAEEYAERIRTLGLFRDVKVVKQEEVVQFRRYGSKLLNYLSLMKSYLGIDRFAEKVLIPGRSYRRLYVSSKAYVGNQLRLYFSKHRTGTELYYFDDGEGSYYNDRTYEHTLPARMFLGLMFGRSALRTDYPKYLYSPELYEKLNGSGDVRRIETDWSRGEPLKWINHVFQVTPDKLMKEAVIIFDTLAGEREKRERLDRCYHMAADILGSDNIIVKRHPRDKSPADERFNQYQDHDTPFEAISANMNMNDKILITYSSTAVGTVKLLMGREPAVILLYRIVNPGAEVNGKRDRYYQSLSELYADGNRIFIPADMAEYEAILRRFRDSDAFKNVLNG